MLSFLLTATGKKDHVTIGKPSTLPFEMITKEHSIPTDKESLSSILMVGDNLETDIKFGKNNQIDTLLVLSGCTSL